MRFDFSPYIGRKYRPFDDKGNYLGCFEPFYLLYENLPKYPLPQDKEAYFRVALKCICENFYRLKDSPKSLDMIVFSFAGNILHAGVYIDEQKFLHVQRGGSFELQRVSPYRDKIFGYFRRRAADGDLLSCRI